VRVNQAVEQALVRAGRLDVVINNAGIAAVGVTEGFTVEQFQHVFEVNLFGVLRGATRAKEPERA
jgi:NAD(P)-dependent dehydrogenase (short-subunit alcohol dehydrogenase family)